MKEKEKKLGRDWGQGRIPCEKPWQKGHNPIYPIHKHSYLSSVLEVSAVPFSKTITSINHCLKALKCTHRLWRVGVLSKLPENSQRGYHWQNLTIV